MISRPNARVAAPDLVVRPAAELPEEVVWLDCRGRSASSLYEDVHGVLEKRPGPKGVLFVIPVHLEQVEGPLTRFVLGLESVLQTSPVPVVLGDPSGYVTLVLKTVHRDADVRIYRPSGASARPRRALIVDGSETSGEVVGAVLETFGHSFTFARTGVEARRAVKSSDYDFGLLDLDLPKMQSFGIAQSLKDRRRVTMVGMTWTDEPWAQENLARYGFRRILPKPPSVLEVLEVLEELA